MATEKEMVEMLRTHYVAPSRRAAGYFCPELQAPGSSRRADAIWLPLTAAQRGQIIGHEIKVSRPDVLTELADPTKSDAWTRYCTQWWLVVSDPAFIDGLEIPSGWGVLAPPSGRSKRTMTVLRPAPRLNPEDQTTALATIMARMFWAGDDVQAKIRFLTADRDQQAETARSLSAQLHDAQGTIRSLGESPREQARVQEVLAAVNQVTRERGSGSWWAERYASADDVAAAIVDVAAARQLSESLSWDVAFHLSQLDHVLAPATRIRDGLKELQSRLSASGEVAAS